jgi:hypothetical protein
MKNRVNDKINKTIEEVKDVNEEDIKDVDEVSEEPEKVTVELTPDQLDKLMTILSDGEKTEVVEVDDESKVKKFFGKLKPTKKKIAIAGGIVAAIAGGVVAGKLSKGNNEEAPDTYPELPDNDNYNPPREDYVEEKETEDSNIEVVEF